MCIDQLCTTDCIKLIFNTLMPVLNLHSKFFTTWKLNYLDIYPILASNQLWDLR